MKLMDIISFYFSLITQASIAKSGSDIDDPCSSLGRRSSTPPALAAVDEEVSFKLRILNIVRFYTSSIYVPYVGLCID